MFDSTLYTQRNEMCDRELGFEIGLCRLSHHSLKTTKDP